MKQFKRRYIIPVITIAALSTGCANQNEDVTSITGGTKQTFGLLLGGIGGGLLGSTIGSGGGQIAATIGGALIGAFLGGMIGKGLDDTDKLMAEHNAQESLELAPTGQVSEWHNPETGRSGTFVVTNTEQMASGGPCREYTTTVTIGGKKQQAYGRACRQQDGDWLGGS